MMTMKKMAIALAVAGISFSSVAAELITPQEAKEKNYQLIGTVTSKNEATSPSGLEEALSKKADKIGGKYYVIVSGKEIGRFVGTAKVYK